MLYQQLQERLDRQQVRGRVNAMTPNDQVPSLDFIHYYSPSRRDRSSVNPDAQLPSFVMSQPERPARPRQSRTTGYHNATNEADAAVEDQGSPPSYITACAPHRKLRSRSKPFTPPGRETLPNYSCTVRDKCPASMKYERTSPFELLETSQWTDVFLVLEGTRLCVHQPQNPSIFSKSGKSVVAGKLLRSYTLQHAEVGVASDCKKYDMICRSPMTAMLPLSIQEKMKETEPNLFEPVRQYILRLRVESDQILIKVRSWDERANWIEKLCAGIDISPSLDERCEPKNHTLPRRRHRQRPNNPAANLRLNNLVESQQRIIRERFPHLLDDGPRREEQGQGETGEADAGDEGDATADPDAEDLDTSVVRGEEQAQDDEAVQAEVSGFITRVNRFLSATPIAGERTPRLAPPLQSQHTSFLAPSAPTQSRPSTSHTQPSRTSEAADHKPNATAQLDASHEARYRRRCMPTLLSNSRRATDIIIYNGCRYTLDWDASVLKPYPEPPPSYIPSSETSPEVPHNRGGDTSALTTVPSNVPSLSLMAPASDPRPLLKQSRSSTTVNESAGSSVEESPGSGNTRRMLKNAVGGWGRRMRVRRRETAIGEMSVVEEKMRRPGTGESAEGTRGREDGLRALGV